MYSPSAEYLHNKIHNVKLTFASKRTRDIYNKRQHAFVGLSPFNSYYSTENITDIMAWTIDTFSSFNIFIPTNLSVYTLLAMGYELDKAEKKVRRQDKYLYNKLVRACNTLGSCTKPPKKFPFLIFRYVAYHKAGDNVICE